MEVCYEHKQTNFAILSCDGTGTQLQIINKDSNIYQKHVDSDISYACWWLKSLHFCFRISSQLSTKYWNSVTVLQLHAVRRVFPKECQTNILRPLSVDHDILHTVNTEKKTSGV